MIIVLKLNPTDEDVKQIEEQVIRLGYDPHTIRGEVRTVVAAVGDETKHADLQALVSLPMVENVMPIQKRYTLVSRATHAEPTVVRVGDCELGNGTFHVMAGPCSVESLDQMRSTAEAVQAAGATVLRGGAFKPRTSPYDFQGLGEEGLQILDKVRRAVGMPVVTEVVCEADIDAVTRHADVLQIGARNALNYSLLEAVAAAGKPILLKRGIAATIEEWLLAAEYIAKQGNRQVILCERGIRTYEPATRNTLDLSAVALAKQETSLPVLVDPSHAGGRTDLVVPLAKAAIGAGADGVIVEVHPHPSEALSDAGQQLTPVEFEVMMAELEPFVAAAGKVMGGKAKTAAE